MTGEYLTVPFDPLRIKPRAKFEILPLGPNDDQIMCRIKPQDLLGNCQMCGVALPADSEQRVRCWDCSGRHARREMEKP